MTAPTYAELAQQAIERNRRERELDSTLHVALESYIEDLELQETWGRSYSYKGHANDQTRQLLDALDAYNLEHWRQLTALGIPSTKPERLAPRYCDLCGSPIPTDILELPARERGPFELSDYAPATFCPSTFCNPTEPKEAPNG